tara:strand:+ start:47 stop:484 length:438 start_codon:yes stop_codon:yes gene_type:complete
MVNITKEGIETPKELYNYLTPKDIENMHHTTCKSFLSSQKYRFEIVESSLITEIPDDLNNYDDGYDERQDKYKEYWISEVVEKECLFMVYDTQLEWLMAYNYYKSIKKNVVKVIDLSALEEQGQTNLHCLILQDKEGMKKQGFNE